MNWKLPNDNTEPMITAQKHIASSHGNSDVLTLPETCIIFQMSMAIPYIEKELSTYTITEHIPGFITDHRCIGISGNNKVCFLQGGFGAPAAVDTLETVLALGVKRIIVMGMCGGFSRAIHVGDVIVPQMVLSEEGTSLHYLDKTDSIYPDKELQRGLYNHLSQEFTVFEQPIVTTDAVYRQTEAKEEFWRKKGCIGVDMESSALLAVCYYYSIPGVAALICSDRHPLPNEAKTWNWGNDSFREKRRLFVRQGVDFVLHNYG